MKPHVSNHKTEVLTTMLKLDSEYYMDLCATTGDKSQKQIVGENIELIRSELKNREESKEVIEADVVIPIEL